MALRYQIAEEGTKAGQTSYGACPGVSLSLVPFAVVGLLLLKEPGCVAADQAAVLLVDLRRTVTAHEVP